MVSTRSLAMTAATLLLAASTVVGATTPSRVKREIGTASAVATVAIPGETMTSMGCFSSSEGLTWTFSYIYMSSAQCQIACLNKNLGVVGVSAKSDCYCGNAAPPKSSKVSDSFCNAGCDGYGKEMCGGANTTSGGVYLTVYNDQLDSAVGYYSASSSASSSSTAQSTSTKAHTNNEPTSTTPSVVTVSGQVVYVTPSSAAAAAAASSTAPTVSNKSHSHTVGIAVGVVVGVIGAFAIAGAIFLFMRRNKRRELEEEHKRQVAQSAFLNNGKPGSSGGDSLPDSRLDPAVLRERRLSDGSIMDNQDYSRRILQVRNL